MQFRNDYKSTKSRRVRRATRIVAIAGALITAYALMLPGITITDDDATPEAGFFEEDLQAQASESDGAAEPTLADESLEPEPAEEPSDPVEPDPAEDSSDSVDDSTDEGA